MAQSRDLLLLNVQMASSCLLFTTWTLHHPPSPFYLFTFPSPSLALLSPPPVVSLCWITLISAPHSWRQRPCFLVPLTCVLVGRHTGIQLTLIERPSMEGREEMEVWKFRLVSNQDDWQEFWDFWLTAFIFGNAPCFHHAVWLVTGFFAAARSSSAL